MSLPLAEYIDNKQPHEAGRQSAGTGPGSYRTSPLALAAAVVFSLAFLISTLYRVAGSYTRYDLRIVAHLIPERDHTHILALIHPLVHLGDAAFLALVAGAAILALWLLGYRRTWATLAGFLSWPVELACKAALPQPDGLGNQQAAVTIASLVHGAGTKTVESWIQSSAPDSVRALAGHAAGISINLVSSYPSGTTARASFAVGLLIWLCLRAEVPVVSDLLALALLAPLSVVGLAMVLYAWHWPSDVLGGYLLGFALLAITLALLRQPIPHERVPLGRPNMDFRARAHSRPHSPRSRLPWIPN